MLVGYPQKNLLKFPTSHLNISSQSQHPMSLLSIYFELRRDWCKLPSKMQQLVQKHNSFSLQVCSLFQRPACFSFQNWIFTQCPFSCLLSHLNFKKDSEVLILKVVMVWHFFLGLLLHPSFNHVCLSKAVMKALSLLSSQQTVTITPKAPREHGLGWGTQIPTSSLIWQRVSKFHPILKRYSLTKKQHTGKKNEVVS